MGRPSIYSDELAERICSRLELGEPLAAICRDSSMPGVRTVLHWADEREDFADQYRRAREAQAEHLDAAIDEAASSAHDKDSAAAARVKITALIWRASKQAPRKYGDKLDVNVDHSFDLAAVIDRRRQRALDANDRLGIPDKSERGG